MFETEGAASSCALQQPTKFEWNKRRSVARTPAADALGSSSWGPQAAAEAPEMRRPASVQKRQLAAELRRPIDRDVNSQA